jgi:HEAT repeat protein
MMDHQRLARLHDLASKRHIDCPTQDEIVVKGLHDESDVVRHEAAFIIGDLERQSRLKDSARALDSLCQAAKDPSILVRHEVALALSKFNRRLQALECLLLLARDPVREVYGSANYAIAEMLFGK